MKMKTRIIWLIWEWSWATTNSSDEVMHAQDDWNYVKCMWIKILVINCMQMRERKTFLTNVGNVTWKWKRPNVIGGGDVDQLHQHQHQHRRRRLSWQSCASRKQLLPLNVLMTSSCPRWGWKREFICRLNGNDDWITLNSWWRSRGI